MLQVFHVPLEERRYTSEPASFGAESPQASIVREIMEKTGCAIEMSQAKDQSLTIMVTGRPSAVIEAKRLINLRLHTQVSRSAVWWEGKGCCPIANVATVFYQIEAWSFNSAFYVCSMATSQGLCGIYEKESIVRGNHTCIRVLFVSTPNSFAAASFDFFSVQYT